MYQTPNGTWHPSVNLGTGLDGKRLRRHVQGRTQGEVRKKLDELKRAVTAGEDLTAPRALTVGEWSAIWIDVMEGDLKPSTLKTYRTHLKYLDPIRRVRLDELTPEHIESVYRKLLARGMKPVSVKGAHRRPTR